MNEHGFLARIIRGELPRPPIMDTLGWQFRSFDAERQEITVEMHAKPEFLNPVGQVHGGMLAAMLDETVSTGLAATLGAGEFAPTIEMKVNFIAPAKAGTIIGTARLVSKGRSISFLAGELRDVDGALVATATATSKMQTAQKSIESLKGGR